jgi:hypothetical protein
VNAARWFGVAGLRYLRPMLKPVGSAVAIAVNATESVVVAMLAETAWAEPETVPVVKVVDALPSVPVTAVAVPVLPSPWVTANVTVLPGMGLPPASLSCITSGAGSGSPATAVWPSPEIFRS